MRFLSVDPLAADYAAWSGFNYVLGNPLIFVDPDGRSAKDYYESESGKVVWKNSSAATINEGGQTLKNIGTSYANFDGQKLTYHYQYNTAHDQQGNPSAGIAPASMSFHAVSGRPDANGMFDYSKGKQQSVDTGPIPEGNFEMNLSEAPNMSFGKHVQGDD